MTLPTLAAASAFAAVSFLIAIAPGASWIYVITSRLRGGARSGALAIAGNGTGILLHTLAVAAGLAAVLQVSQTAFVVFRILGAGYLIYLGVRTLLRDPVALDAASLDAAPLDVMPSTKPVFPAPTQSESRQVYRDGVLMALLNPKISLLILALMPQFVEPERGSVPLQVVTLGLLHLTIASLVLTVVAIASGALTRWLIGSDRARMAFRLINGGLLVLFGIGLLFARRA